jgi:hypothetical protein
MRHLATSLGHFCTSISEARDKISGEVGSQHSGSAYKLAAKHSILFRRESRLASFCISLECGKEICNQGIGSICRVDKSLCPLVHRLLLLLLLLLSMSRRGKGAGRGGGRGRLLLVQSHDNSYGGVHNQAFLCAMRGSFHKTSPERIPGNAHTHIHDIIKYH